MITPPNPPIGSFLVDCKSPDLREQVYSPGYRYRSWQGLFVFFLLLQLLQLYTVAAWVDRSGMGKLRRVSYRRGVRARRADFSPFQVDRPHQKQQTHPNWVTHSRHRSKWLPHVEGQ